VLNVTPQSGSPPLVEMRKIRKAFANVLANNDVDLSVRASEIHALLGENGAGKTTLMGILSGYYQPDAGAILLEGKPVRVRSPGEAIRNGVGMVHQHFRLIDSFTVAENMSVGLREAGWLLNPRAIESRIGELAERYGLRVNPAARVGALSVGERQRVEILRALYRGARILILDEPTAMLTPQETRSLFATLRLLVREGAAIIFISHKLKEVLEIADRITLMRGGKVVAEAAAGEMSEATLVHHMVGRDLVGLPERRRSPPGEVVLAVAGLRAKHDAEYEALRGVSLEVRRGEIVGVAGVAGNGQRELADTLAGLRPATAGRVLLGGRDVTNCTPTAIHAAGLVYVPEDRLEQGLGPELPLTDNLIARDYRRPPLARGPFLDGRAIVERAARAIENFGIRGAKPDTAVKMLSGGNAQKVLLARELGQQPKVLIAAQPTRGLDVAATETVQKLLLEQAAAGAGILLISEDLDVLRSLSDRLLVMYEGAIVGSLAGGAVDMEAIGLLMAGARQGQAEESGDQVRLKGAM